MRIFLLSLRLVSFKFKVWGIMIFWLSQFLIGITRIFKKGDLMA
ncbi:hypothetical protein HMPREF1400_00194 [Helicobacter pylori GAM119Bi]|nr:hypothetical protein HMPREF1400_00194 [Helicobacter pylori GAM119Bi]